MKYIRTKDGELGCFTPKHEHLLDNVEYIKENGIVKTADTIEELCDCFIGKVSDEEYIHLIGLWERKNYPAIREVYGAIWTDKGLIYVAKMNDEGVLELL